MGARISTSIRESIARELRDDPGKSMAAIAHEHGVSKTFVRDLARALGGPGASAERSERTKNARQAKIEQLALRRAALSERLLGEAERLVASLQEPHVAFNFGGKDNTYNEHPMDKPDVKSAQVIMTTAAIALDKHAMLERLDAGSEVDEAASLLGQLGAALTRQYGDGSNHRTESEVDRDE